MVSFFKRAGEIIRGESPVEGEERRKSERELRSDVRQAQMVARREQAIKFAQRREEIIREAKERKLKQQYSPVRSQFGSANPFGGGGLATGFARPVSRRARRRSSRMSNRRMSRRRSVRRTAPRRQGYVDILGFG